MIDGVVACTLCSADQPLRLAAFADLFATAVRAVDRIDPTRLRFTLDPRPAVAARAAGEQLALEVAVPPDRTAALDGLAGLATAGSARP